MDGHGSHWIIGSFAVLTNSRRTLRWLWLPVVTLVYCTLLPLQKEHDFFFHRATHPMAGLPIHWAHEMTRHDLNQIAGTLAQQAINKADLSAQQNASPTVADLHKPASRSPIKSSARISKAQRPR